MRDDEREVHEHKCNILFVIFPRTENENTYHNYVCLNDYD